MISFFNGIKALTVCAACAFGTSAQAALVSVDWAPDSSVDGIATGTFTSTGTVSTNAGNTSVTLTSTVGGINGGSTFTPGGLNYFFSDYAGSLPGMRDTFNQPFLDQNGQPLVRNEIGTFDWLNGQAGSVDLSFGGKFLRDPILVFSFTQPQSAYDFADNVPVQVLGQTISANPSIGPGNVVSGDGFFGGPSAGLSIGLTGVFNAISFGTNAFQSTPTANGLTILVEESNILLEPPATPTPVPAPAALPLLLIALGGLALLRKRRRRV